MTVSENTLRLRQPRGVRFSADRVLALLLAVSMITFTPVTFAKASETAGDAQAANLNSNPSADYHLAPGDHLMIEVYDQPQLSGEFIIDGGGGVLLPLAGPVSLNGVTLAEAQKLIQARFADGVLVQPGVSVRIKEYRPIFVTGNVRKPGSYPFIIGESVKAAVAAAGGKGEPVEAPLNGAVSDFITAKQRVRTLEADYANLLVRKARLEAQRDGRENFVMPILVGFSRSNVDFERAYATENDIFAHLTNSYQTQVATLLKQRPLIQAEIDSVTAQIANQKERLDIVNNRLNDLQGLFSKGLLTKMVLQNQQIERSLVEGQISGLRAQVAGLKQRMGEVDVKLGDLNAAYLKDSLAQLQDTSQRLRDIENSIGPARRLLEVKAQSADGAVDEADYTIRISRVRDGRMVTFDATEEMMLSPGDVVEIKMKRRDSDSDSTLPTQAIREFNPASALAEGSQSTAR